GSGPAGGGRSPASEHCRRRPRPDLRHSAGRRGGAPASPGGRPGRIGRFHSSVAALVAGGRGGGAGRGAAGAGQLHRRLVRHLQDQRAHLADLAAGGRGAEAGRRRLSGGRLDPARRRHRRRAGAARPIRRSAVPALRAGGRCAPGPAATSHRGPGGAGSGGSRPLKTKEPAMRRTIPVALAALLLSAGALTACQEPRPAVPEKADATPSAAAATAEAMPMAGQAAPAFTLVDAEGTQRSLADFRGRTVVLEWTNEGCPYVQKHYTGALQALQREAVDQGVVWLTIISSAPGTQGYVEGEQARAWRERTNGAATHLLLDPT